MEVNMQVPVIENVLKVNDEIAALNRATLAEAAVFTIDLIGAPGCGKTTLLEATLARLQDRIRVGVICADLATQRDGERISRWCTQIVQINTGHGCHLEAHHVQRALARLDLVNLDILFIENVGNLICPVGFDLGQDAKVGMFSVGGGDDKAAKHPYLVREAKLLVLNQIDLLPHIAFDLDRFRDDIHLINETATLLELSSTTGQGFDLWLEWLNKNVRDRAVAAEQRETVTHWESLKSSS
jgi:hydrogenase nickel incorporation protein HypB